MFDTSQAISNSTASSKSNSSSQSSSPDREVTERLRARGMLGNGPNGGGSAERRAHLHAYTHLPTCAWRSTRTSPPAHGGLHVPSLMYIDSFFLHSDILFFSVQYLKQQPAQPLYAFALIDFHSRVCYDRACLYLLTPGHPGEYGLPSGLLLRSLPAAKRTAHTQGGATRAATQT